MISKELRNFWELAFRKRDRLILIIVSVTMLTVVPVGYHIIVLNVPAKQIQTAIFMDLKKTYRWELSDSTMDLIWSFIISCQSIGALFGCIFVVPFQKCYGTRRSLMFVNNILLLIGSACFWMGQYFFTLWFLIAGRVMIGMHTGIGTALVPMYIQELTPSKMKGALCCFVHIAICVGSALGAVLSLETILGNIQLWPYLLAIPPAVFGIVQIILAKYLIESPNYFLENGEKKMAAESVRFHYSLSQLSDEDALTEYENMVTTLPPQISFREAIVNPETRYGIWLGICISVAQIFSGSMAVVSYSTSMLTSVSFTSAFSQWMPAFGAILSVILTLPALVLVETCGRRKLFLNTLLICAVSEFMLAIFSLITQLSGSGAWSSFAFCGAFLLYGIGYNVGVGPVAYFLPGELVGAEATGLAMGCAVAANWLSTMLTTLVYYPLNEFMGGWSFLMFALPTTLLLLYLTISLPKVNLHFLDKNVKPGTSFDQLIPVVNLSPDEQFEPKISTDSFRMGDAYPDGIQNNNYRTFLTT